MSEDGQLSFDGQGEEPVVVERVLVTQQAADSDPGHPRQEEPTGPPADETQTEKDDTPNAGAALAPDQPDHEPTQALYYLTNRLNLNGILSSRILAPRDSFQKYYADLLTRTPGWVPLLRGLPARALVATVSAEEGSGGPVLLEFPPDLPDVEPSPDKTVGFIRAACLSDAIAIHFPDRRSLREHSARKYSNVHPHDDLLRESPELFEGGPVTELPPAPPPSEPSPLDWRDIDRTRGAVSGVVAAARSAEGLDLAAACLGAAAATRGPEWLTWASLSQIAGKKPRGQADADRLLFDAADADLARRDANNAWDPKAVLAAITETALAATNKRSAKQIASNLETARQIVAVEREFQAFRDTSRALVSAKALLLTLLRPVLADLVEWPEESTGADEATSLTAGALSGRLRGLAREAVVLRSRVLDDATARWAVNHVHGRSEPLGEVDVEVSVAGSVLRLDGQTVKTGPPPIPSPRDVYLGLSDERRADFRVRAARAFGWPIVARGFRFAGTPATRVTDAALEVETENEVETYEVVFEPAFLTMIEKLGRADRATFAQLPPGS